MNEKYVEELLWQWLKDNLDIYGVYFNRKNEINAPIFQVEGESREIPDLIVKCKIFGKEEYLAVEVKNGEEGINVLKSNKILNIYYDNYVRKKTKYLINNKEIQITRFIVATQYSKFGKLFRDNEIIVVNGSGTTKESWINKNVPLNEYSRTKDFGRMLMHDFAEYRKKNKIIEGAGIGWLISDIILRFDSKELEVQHGMVGKPLIQGVFYNSKLKRWCQSISII